MLRPASFRPAILLLAPAVFAVAVMACGRKEKTPEVASSEASSPDGAAQGTSPEAPGAAPGAVPGGAASGPASFTGEQNRREVSLFFQKAQADLLGTERRKIFTTSSVADQAKQILVELINGPHGSTLLPTLPPQTRVLGFYLDRFGTAYVDLSDDLVNLHPGGSAEELATLFSVVDSLTFNLSEIKKVHILVGGEERDILKSHVDLRRNYTQDLSVADMGGRS